MNAVAATMVPPVDRLPQVLPTDTLGPAGRPLPPLRDELRRIAGFRNAVSVAGLWAAALLLVVGVPRLGRWWLLPPAFVLMGPVFARFAILAHEAAHRLLFARRRVNDVVGAWVLAYPAFVPIVAYRRGHMAHHRDEFGPQEPDLALYAGYPIPADSWRRKLTRDAVGITGWKNLKGLLRALRSSTARPAALRILGTQVVLAVLLGVAAGAWWVWPVLWFGPWMTVWRVLNRLRGVAEHGGMERSDDKRRTTHHVRQSALARFWIVPYCTGWHLAHHVDPGVPWRNLPRLHDELVQAGYVTDALTYPSYVALWRAMTRPAEEKPAGPGG